MTASAYKLLLIDDSEISLRVVSAVLATAGFEVRTAVEVDDLETALGGWRPDLILTDVDMPGMSGVELCRRLKSLYETAHVPVILLSGYPPDELEVLAGECEADGFLCKSGLDQLLPELGLVIESVLF